MPQPRALEPRTIGVEEELLVVDHRSGEVSARPRITAHEGVDAELKREQIEVQTPPCLQLSELGDEILRQRRVAQDAAQLESARVAASATSPLPVTSSTTRHGRYLRIAQEYGMTGREQLTCGCHVHVEVYSRDEGVGVLDRLRPWTAVLLALSANSPFWQGEDSGYASYRNRVWGRWPSAGPTDVFGSAATYDRTVDAMVDSGVLLDRKMAYFDARLAEDFPTVEVRAADVCLRAEDTLLVAALVRGLVLTAADEWARGEPVPDVRTEVLRVASWRAARSALTGRLVDPLHGGSRPARELVEALVAYVTPALESCGDLDLVRASVDEVLARGTGADRQRAVYAESGSLDAVVQDIVGLTS